MRTVHVVIAGRVQGIGYRAWVAGEAQRRGLAGWCRNRRDGTVEAVFSGTAESVAEMRDACRAGPPAAAVTGIDVADTEAPAEAGFHVLPTA